MMLEFVLILGVVVVLGLPPLELMQCIRPTLYLVQGGVQQLFIVELISMEM